MSQTADRDARTAFARCRGALGGDDMGFGQGLSHPLLSASLGIVASLHQVGPAAADPGSPS